MKKMLKLGIVLMGILILAYSPVTECEGGDFGYYGGSSWVGNYLGELNGASNVATLEESEWNIANAIIEAHNNGMKSIIMVGHIFFDIQNFGLPNMTIEMYPDYQARWNSFAAHVSPYQAHVRMFYVLDEPYWNGQRAGISQPDMKEMLELAATAIAGTFPSIDRGTCFAYIVINANLVLPANFTLVGFDYYYYPPQSAEAYTYQYGQYLNVFLSKMTGSQGLFLVPGGFVSPSNPVSQAILNRVADFFRYVYLNVPRAEMMLVYLYPTTAESIGLIELPWTFYYYETYVGPVIVGN